MDAGSSYLKLIKEVEASCKEANRAFDSVCVCAVSKTVGIDKVLEAYRAGALVFGENRPDALMEKHDQLPQATWHFIGNIQSRRIDDIVGRATLIHSVCAMRHVEKIDECAAALNIAQKVLVEVNVSGEETKSGISPREVLDFLHEAHAFSHVQICGFMTMAPQGDPAYAREVFEQLAYLKEFACSHADESVAKRITELSMGMSEDWHEALRAGATIIRVGRAIFSEEFSTNN